MSYPEQHGDQIGKAERAFREAFARLKIGQPQRISKTSKITQNNVAREAGLDPSALKKLRFPALVGEIQNWVREYSESTSPSSRQEKEAQRSKNRTLKQQINDLKAQRDAALALLVQADAKIVDLTRENRKLLARCPPSNVNYLPRITDGD